MRRLSLAIILLVILTALLAGTSIGVLSAGLPTVPAPTNGGVVLHPVSRTITALPHVAPTKVPTRTPTPSKTPVPTYANVYCMVFDSSYPAGYYLVQIQPGGYCASGHVIEW